MCFFSCYFFKNRCFLSDSVAKKKNGSKLLGLCQESDREIQVIKIFNSRFLAPKIDDHSKMLGKVLTFFNFFQVF